MSIPYLALGLVRGSTVAVSASAKQFEKTNPISVSPQTGSGGKKIENKANVNDRRQNSEGRRQRKKLKTKPIWDGPKLM